MDRLGERLEEAGITANVYEFTICRLIAAQAIHEYRENPEPIILIGHSMGGFCAVKFAEILEDEGIRADLVVAIDPAHVTPDVPLNVDRFINIFLSKSVLGGGDVKAKPGFRGHYASFDLSLHDEVSHITIEKMDTVQQQLVTKVLQLATTRAEGRHASADRLCRSGKGSRRALGQHRTAIPANCWQENMPTRRNSCQLLAGKHAPRGGNSCQQLGGKWGYSLSVSVRIVNWGVRTISPGSQIGPHSNAAISAAVRRPVTGAAARIGSC